MSREMKGAEIDRFEAKYGYKPTRIRVALDGLAVYVNKDNPIEKLTFKQLDGIFSSTRKRGGKDIKTWGDLGLTGDWANKPISLFGRNSASGTYGYFKEHALENGDYKNSVKEQPGSSSVVQGVAEDKYAIGYSGVGYTTSGVKTVPISAKDDGPFVGESYENVLTGQVPPRPLPERLRQQGPRQAARPAREAVPPLRSLEGGSGDRRQGRLLPPHGEGHRRRDRQTELTQDPGGAPLHGRAAPSR